MAAKEKNIPGHIGIVMSGSRRWAAERHLSADDGYLKSLEKMNASPDWFFPKGVRALSFFVFSAEHWNRDPEEVNGFMKIFRQETEESSGFLAEKGCRLMFSGRIAELPGDLPSVCQAAADKTKDGAAGIINVCLNYGGREEIVDAVKKMIKNKIEENQVHEGLVKKYLYSGELPDPSLIVRFGGDDRPDGFLLWESAFSELMALRKYWPDFEPADAEYILNEYARRKAV